MKTILLGTTLLFASAAMAQQQMPSEAHPPAQTALPSSAIQQQIQDKIASFQ